MVLSHWLLAKQIPKAPYASNEHQQLRDNPIWIAGEKERK
jgi:hypothetical protein